MRLLSSRHSQVSAGDKASTKDWASLGGWIRQAAEESVAAGGMENVAIEVRRHLREHTASALAVHHPLTVSTLLSDLPRAAGRMGGGLS